MSEENTSPAAAEAVEKKKKKLAKNIEGTVVTITESVTGTVLKYDFDQLSTKIQALFGPFGLGHKLGDAAAGKEGQEAVDAINKVWDGLMKDDWSVRAPAAEKISKKTILDKFNEMPEGKEKVALKKALETLGFKF